MIDRSPGNPSTTQPIIDGETILQRMNPDKNATGMENNTGFQSQSNPPTNYTVADGDTLFTIAQKVYGDGTQWHTILDANQAAVGSDSTQLPVGAVLVIPAAAQGSASQNPPSWSNPTFRHW
jgi:nucleoid-associated protein YgaU